MNRWQVVFSRTLAAGFALLLAAGASGEVSPQASSGLTQVRAEAVRIKEQVGHTAAATRKLARSRASNLAGSLDSLSTNLGNLKSTLAGARETVRATEDQTTAYFARWDEQLTGMSEEMQKTGQKRQAEVMASFAAVRADLADVRTSLKPFVDALSEMEQYLRTDQTKAGLDTVSSRLRSTAEQEHVIRRDLDKLIKQIDTIQRKR